MSAAPVYDPRFVRAGAPSNGGGDCSIQAAIAQVQFAPIWCETVLRLTSGRPAGESISPTVEAHRPHYQSEQHDDQLHQPRSRRGLLKQSHPNQNRRNSIRPSLPYIISKFQRMSIVICDFFVSNKFLVSTTHLLKIKIQMTKLKCKNFPSNPLFLKCDEVLLNCKTLLYIY